MEFSINKIPHATENAVKCEMDRYTVEAIFSLYGGCIDEGGKAMDFVVIGGDAAGMSAASRAKRNRPDIRVTVIEKTQDVSYSACGMPYNIADPSRPMEDLVVREADAFRKQGIAVLTGHHATRIDRTAKTVSGRTSEGNPFSVSYDALLIATGASPIVPDIPGLDLPGVMVLKAS